MNKKLVLVLSALWFFVLIYKYPIWENLAFSIGDYINYGSQIYDISFFCAFFLFPFSLSLLFLYCFRKYKNSYRDIAKWCLKIIIILAVVFAFHGLFGVFPRLTDHLPILGGLLGVLVLFEGYLSTSLLLLFIALFFFAFGKKSTLKNDEI